MKNLFYILIVCFTIIACNKTPKEKVENNKTNIEETKNAEVAANLHSFQVNIDGMTCEIGCAKLIQSKLYKIDGVSYAKVDFEHTNGIITYDSNKLNEKEIVQKIEAIAGGDLYSVSKTIELDTIIN
ncbi:heavy-metal-associated domain-containing protein [Lutibacter sp. TH_r2]|uniref:heavy-metal-associated domain-containing protein n=1 Tax=Lutibacter sp. TH_r2 TaxID=3082083 RepID=UPI0029553B1F|nr:heavy-metal-associated domain-containing protein [Lutibacter sp. TH_r2]MDV7186273.1 heavy-metal-associated domain-containing protein [Lutibacter sp. TH_r2]